MRRVNWLSVIGVWFFVLSAAMPSAHGCCWGRGGRRIDGVSLASYGGWNGYWSSGCCDSGWDRGWDYPSVCGYGPSASCGYGADPYGYAGPDLFDPSVAGSAPPAPPPPAWRVLAGHADSFEYVAHPDRDEHPRATMVRVEAPLLARVWLDDRELKQGHDGVWRYAPKEPIVLHQHNVHTVRAEVEYNGETFERTVTFRLQPGKLLKIRFE